jgi:hypothetical protein
MQDGKIVTNSPTMHYSFINQNSNLKAMHTFQRSFFKGCYFILFNLSFVILLDNRSLNTFDQYYRPLAHQRVVLLADTEIKLSELKALKRLDATFPSFKAQSNCPVIRFNLFFLARKKDGISIVNPGETFSEYTLKLIDQAQVGDHLIFDNIRIMCVGEESSKKYGGIGLKVIAD